MSQTTIDSISTATALMNGCSKTTVCGLIVSPESGGRALALIDKSWAASVSTSVGLFRDNFSFTENPPGISQSRTRGKYGLFNRPYAAAWSDDAVHPTLNLQYEAADIFPSGAKIEKSIQLDGARQTARRLSSCAARQSHGVRRFTDHPSAVLCGCQFVSGRGWSRRGGIRIVDAFLLAEEIIASLVSRRLSTAER